jgi:hypothetical protein
MTHIFHTVSHHYQPIPLVIGASTFHTPLKNFSFFLHVYLLRMIARGAHPPGHLAIDPRIPTGPLPCLQACVQSLSSRHAEEATYAWRRESSTSSILSIPPLHLSPLTHHCPPCATHLRVCARRTNNNVIKNTSSLDFIGRK